MKIWKKCLALLLLAAVLTGCAGTPSGALPTASAADMTRTSGVHFNFDTILTVTFYGADATLMDDVWAACDRYERMLSKTVPGSDVSRINEANGQPVQVSAETYAILQQAKILNEMTEGAFSVTIAPVMALWDFTGGTDRMPASAELAAALPLVDDRAIQLGEDRTVTLPAGMQIDLGGIAKGYIADQVAELAWGRCTGMILSLGGNVYVIGDRPDLGRNAVGIQDPASPTGSSLAVLYVKNTSVVTSGVYERGFTGPDGAWYHHILNPETGYPADSGLVSATIVNNSSMVADALATACIVMGREKALAFAEQYGMEAMFIDSDMQTWFTDGFQEKYQYILYQDLVKQTLIQ